MKILMKLILCAIINEVLLLVQIKVRSCCNYMVDMFPFLKELKMFRDYLLHFACFIVFIYCWLVHSLTVL